MYCNKNKDKNVRDLGVAFGLAIIIYGCIGMVGAIGISSKYYYQPTTILDYFQPNDIGALII
jgi:hypothetical protein